MTVRERIAAALQTQPRKWLVTGAAGFIGSALVEELLQLDQEVVGLDNFFTGKRENLEDLGRKLPLEQWGRFRFVEADIRDLEACRRVCGGVDFVLHQAALGSVPRSLDDPITTNQANVDGFVNMLLAARDAGVKRFVYAASSSTYGDDPALPKVEDRIGRPLSPYAVTNTSMNFMPMFFPGLTGWKPWACGISMCSAGGRIPRGLTRRLSPAGSRLFCAGSSRSSTETGRSAGISAM